MDSSRSNATSTSSQYKQLKKLLAKSEFFSSHLSRTLEQTVKDKEKTNVPTSTQDSEIKTDPQVQGTYDEKQEAKENSSAKANEGGDTEGTSDKINFLGHNIETKQPIFLEGGHLRDYQLLGVNWMTFLFQNGMNGILADEMGLGKTIQVIGFLCTLYEKGVKGPFLIVTPLSTLYNWLAEFLKFAPKLPVVCFHGNPEERRKLHRNINDKYKLGGTSIFPVVLTSFEIPIKEVLLSRFYWKYLVVDEGHRLKNHNSVLSRTLNCYKKANCLLLTGTPLQNNLTELWSLLHFILPQVFDNMATFENILELQDLEAEGGVVKLLEKEKGHSIVSALHQILKPFMLRRVKTDVCLELPKKEEKVVYCPLTEDQISLYTNTVNQNVDLLLKKPRRVEQLIIPDGPNGERVKRRRSRPVSFLEEFYDEDSLERVKRRCYSDSLSDSSESVDSRKHINGFKNFSQGFKGFPEGCQLNEKRRNLVSYNSSEDTFLDEGQEISEGFKGFPDAHEGLVGSTVTGLIKFPDVEVFKESPVEEFKDFSDEEGFKGFPNENEFKDFPVQSKRKKISCSTTDFIDSSTEDSIGFNEFQERFESSEEGNTKNTGYMVNVKMNNPAMMLRKISNHPYLIRMPINSDNTMVLDDGVITQSGKMLVLDQLLTKLKATDHKVLIFSTFTSMLDVLEQFVILKQYKYVRLDGSVSLENRREAIDKFSSDSQTFIFLISTRAGGLGVNLTSADTVILFDSDWNPQVDLQAQDRCHRIGQKKPVLVLRLISKGTIEEKILSRASSKLALEKLVILKGKFKYSNKLCQDAIDMKELQELLKATVLGIDIPKSPNCYALSDAEIESLLERNHS